MKGLNILKLKDLTGKRFGRLTVLRKATGEQYKRVHWECICDCGNTCIVAGNNLGRSTNSCGCLETESRVTSNTKHGQRNSRIYYIWCSMKQRCNNPKCESFQHYGGKGISYCKEWETFENFYKWAIANGYNDSLSIDRIDNSKNYSPENCRWVTMKVQQNNRGGNRILEYNGEQHTLSQWADIKHISQSTLESRLYRGMTVKDALETPVR